VPKFFTIQKPPAIKRLGQRGRSRQRALKQCRAQELRLAARRASEQLVSGSVWYDDMQIARLSAGAAANAP
jgi:hypothetical protein